MPSRGRERSNPILDPDDFAAFYARHSQELLLYFTRRVYEPEIAMDLTAETFAQALDKRGRFRGTTAEEAAGWLYAIARGRLGRFARRGRSERRAIVRLGIETPRITEQERERILELADVSELRDAVRLGLERLSGEQREALQLRVVDELSYPEVAERLGVSEQAARARVSRGLRALAARVEAMEAGA